MSVTRDFSGARGWKEEPNSMWRESLNRTDRHGDGNVEQACEHTSCDVTMSGFGSRLDGGNARTPQMQYLNVYDPRTAIGARRFKKSLYRPLTLKPVSYRTLMFTLTSHLCFYCNDCTLMFTLTSRLCSCLL